jgi:hypothetical protein
MRPDCDAIVAGHICLDIIPALSDEAFSFSPGRLLEVGPPILSTGVTRTFSVQGVCGVPAGAKAASINVTAVRPNGAGHLTLFPTGGSVPVVSTVNFAAGEPAIANGAIVPLAASAPDLSVSPYVAAPGGTVHLVIDVTGYFQ